MQTPRQDATALDWALWYASMGFRVFPLREGEKVPALKGWQEAATNDPVAVLDLWAQHKAANVGVSCEGWAVFDVDVKGDRDGRPAYAALSLPPTLTVETPTGGTHYYWKAEAVPATRDRIGAGIDVQGDGVYVVGAGSQIGGKPYRVTVAEIVHPLPEALRERLGKLRDAADQPSALIAADTVSAVAMAVRLASEAPPAIEGHGGNRHTYDVARELKRVGVSATVALGILLETFNPRCSPPWNTRELRVLVNSAYASKEPLGIGNPTVEFGTVKETAPLGAEALFSAPVLKPRDIKPRPWIVKNVLLEGAVTALVGPGGVGKSLWQLYLAICTAIGDGTAIGERIPEARNVLVINNEDDLSEMYRRYYSACAALKVDPATLVGKVFLYSGVGSRFKAVVRNEKRELEATPAMTELVEQCQLRGVGAVMMDPFVKLHDGEENDAKEIDDVTSKFIKLAFDARIAVMISHHTRKPSGASSEGYGGDANGARGSSALPAATRVLLTMYQPSAADCKKRGIPEDDRRNFLMIDDGKSNYGPYGAGKWFKKSVHDVEGLPEPEVYLELQKRTERAAEAPKVAVADAEQRDIASEVVSLIFQRDCTKPYGLYDVAKDLRKLRPQWDAMDLRVFHDVVLAAVNVSDYLRTGDDGRTVRLEQTKR